MLVGEDGGSLRSQVGFYLCQVLGMWARYARTHLFQSLFLSQKRPLTAHCDLGWFQKCDLQAPEFCKEHFWILGPLLWDVPFQRYVAFLDRVLRVFTMSNFGGNCGAPWWLKPTCCENKKF